MKKAELVELIAKGAASVVGGRYETVGRSHRIAFDDGQDDVLFQVQDDLSIAAPPHRMVAAVRGAAGRVYNTAAPVARLEELLPGLEPPVLLARFDAVLYSASPRTLRFGLAVSLGGGETRELSAAACGHLAAVLMPSAVRVEEADLTDALLRLRAAADDRVAEAAEEAKAALLSLQSRKRREVETVFQERLMAADEAPGENGDADLATRLAREQRAAIEHVEAYYDPNNLLVRLSARLVVLVHPRIRRSRDRRADG